jgi:eukaryotic-like serine/threonine-protein kinase
MDTQVADTLLGTLVDGRYRISGRVSRGGMATVYTAVDERLERTVALKIIHPAQARESRARSADFLERFTDEAKTIARLTHPNVVAVYDQGIHAGMPYLVMEYVRGRTLRDVLAERRRLMPVEAVAILEQVLAAIAAAHRAGLVHRDVKPENVLVAEAPSGGAGNLVDSVVKVADFGLARAVEASADDDGGGQLMATVAYVAPELVTDGHADTRTDVYSAGIVLFEMLTGRVPYDGDRPVEVAWRHVDRDVPAPSTFVAGLSPVLDDLVVRATRRDPDARPSDAGALLADVQVVREALGNANANTAVLRQLAPPTLVVSAVPAAGRPSWARLPASRNRSPARRRASNAQPPLDQRVRAVGRQLMRERYGRLGLIAAVVALVLLVAGGAWWYGVGRYAPAPQLTSLAKAEAEARAAQAGFAVRYGQPLYDERVARNVVLTQRPPPDARLVRGGTITLVLSLGPERHRVPDVLGKAFEVAQVELQRAKLVVKRGADKYDDNLPAGVVLDVQPPVGSQTRPGDPVTVIVSKGKAPLSVPNLVGKNINDARAQLQQMGLVPVETYRDSDKPKDEVIGQSPADGTGAEPGAEVRLEVSKGPPAVPVPRVVGMPCPQAQQVLASQGFAFRVDFNPNGTVAYQNPPPDSPVPPGTEVVIGCV